MHNGNGRAYMVKGGGGVMVMRMEMMKKEDGRIKKEGRMKFGTSFN